MVRKSLASFAITNSYAEYSISEQGFSGGFLDFCRQPPAGGDPYPIKQVPAESETVSNQWANERYFPVPISVDPSGSMYMDAHIRLDSKGSISPRIYFHDDTAGSTKAILIGMIGRHLTNTKT
ncbi:hypothetical protein [Acrocarpospora catenulata]|uniref:hypothetical protein n=1 Tax=Acrocarpospora catenulata TaxID=2836182 RepID=UPI001BD9FA03|nr:hypothetical protein [Acrocarpospora catenulata]